MSAVDLMCDEYNGVGRIRQEGSQVKVVVVVVGQTTSTTTIPYIPTSTSIPKMNRALHCRSQSQSIINLGISLVYLSFTTQTAMPQKASDLMVADREREADVVDRHPSIYLAVHHWDAPPRWNSHPELLEYSITRHDPTTMDPNLSRRPTVDRNRELNKGTNISSARAVPVGDSSPARAFGEERVRVTLLLMLMPMLSRILIQRLHQRFRQRRLCCDFVTAPSGPTVLLVLGLLFPFLLLIVIVILHISRSPDRGRRDFPQSRDHRILCCCRCCYWYLVMLLRRVSRHPLLARLSILSSFRHNRQQSRTLWFLHGPQYPLGALRIVFSTAGLSGGNFSPLPRSRLWPLSRTTTLQCPSTLGLFLCHCDSGNEIQKPFSVCLRWYRRYLDQQCTHMRQAVNHAQVVDLIATRAILMCRPDATIVAVEDAVTPLIPRSQFGRHFGASLAHRHGFFFLQGQSQLARFPGTFQPGRRSRQQSRAVFVLVSFSARLKDLKGRLSQILLVALAQVMDSNQQRIVHDLESLQKRDISPLDVFFPEVSADRRTLEVEHLMNIPVWWEQVVHDDKVDFPTVRDLDPMQPIKLADQRVGIVQHMAVVVPQNLSQKLMLGVMDGFDNVFVVAGKIKKRARLSRTAQFRQDVFASQTDQIVGWIETKGCPEMPENPGSFPVISKLNLCLASKSASVNSRSIFALVLDTVNRMPVSILYAVTQLAWPSSTFLPTITRSSSSSSLFFRRLALFCLINSVQRAASSSGGTSSKCESDCIDRVVRRTSPSDARRASSEGPAENEKSREVRPVAMFGFGTCNVWRARPSDRAVSGTVEAIWRLFVRRRHHSAVGQVLISRILHARQFGQSIGRAVAVVPEILELIQSVIGQGRRFHARSVGICEDAADGFVMGLSGRTVKGGVGTVGEDGERRLRSHGWHLRCERRGLFLLCGYVGGGGNCIIVGEVSGKGTLLSRIDGASRERTSELNLAETATLQCTGAGTAVITETRRAVGLIDVRAESG
ncbi:SAICAR synthase-like protein, partial [Aureobasidium melanogenum]